MEYYFFLFPEFFPVPHQINVWFFKASAFTLAAFALIGLVQNYKKYYFYILFCGFYLAILMVYQPRQGGRFLFPIVPFYFFFVLHGIAYLCRRFLPDKARQGVSIFASLFFTLLLISQTAYLAYRDYFRKDNLPVLSPKAKELYRYVKQYTGVSDTILFFKPRVLRLFTDRKVTFSFDPENSMKLYDYLIVFDAKRNSSYKNWRAYLSPLKDKLLFDNGDFQLYKLSVK